MWRKVLLICDRKNWSYDAIARGLIKYHHKDFVLDVFYLKGGEKLLPKIVDDYDLLFVLGWQLLADLEEGRMKIKLPYLDPKRTITGVHSHHAWDQRETTPERDVFPPPLLVDYLNRFLGVNAVSRRLYRVFSAAGLRNLSYTPNGVDTDLFCPKQPLSPKGSLRIGFSGNQRHDWRKGIEEFIKPACDLPYLSLHLAMPQGDYVPLDQMPQFYNELDVYVCASASEGFSLSVLEAAGCGRPVITTKVGGCEELIIDGHNGFFVKREVADIQQKINRLHQDRDLLRFLSRNIRQTVEEKWSWQIRSRDWLEFIEKHLKMAPERKKSRRLHPLYNPLERVKVRLAARNLFPWYQPIDLGAAFSIKGVDKDFRRHSSRSLDRGIRKWKKFIEPNLPLDLNGARILECGCNAGRFLIESLRLGAREAIGIESNPHYLEQAHLVADLFSKIDRRGYLIQFYSGRMEDFDFKQLGKVDLTLFLNTLYHVGSKSENREIQREKQLRTLREAAAISKYLLFQGNPLGTDEGRGKGRHSLQDLIASAGLAILKERVYPHPRGLIITAKGKALTS